MRLILALLITACAFLPADDLLSSGLSSFLKNYLHVSNGQLRSFTYRHTHDHRYQNTQNISRHGSTYHFLNDIMPFFEDVRANTC